MYISSEASGACARVGQTHKVSFQHEILLSALANSYLLENEMLKNVNFLKIVARLDMPIGRQSFATITPMWNGATNKIQFFSNF